MIDKINNFYFLYDANFKYLQSIKCERLIDEASCEADGTYEIQIILSKYENVSPKKIMMYFLGGTNLKIGKLDGLFGMLVDIRDISSNGLENINFEVREIEYDTFSFVCKDFSIEVI